ncbi:MAG: MFS transporter [Gammaproteobacteria bacterium]|nr:MFS transporter [Gammaproteobacteria bacterium]
MNREERKILGLTTSSHSLVHMYEGVLPPLIPLLVGEFSTDYFHLGIVVTVFSYAFGLGSLPAGYLSDRVGPRRLITLYLFGAGFLSVCILPVGSLWTYGILMGLIGLFCSPFHPASNTLISHGIREKGKAFGINGIAGSLGIAIVPALSAWIGSAIVWKAPHVLFGLLGIGIGFFSMTIPRWPVKKRSVGVGKESEAGLSKISYLNLIVFFTSAAALGLTYKGIMTFLPTYMGQNVHLSFFKLDTVAIGGTIATIALLSGAAGQYVAGRLVDRYKPERLYLGAVVFGTIFVFLMAKGLNIFLVVSAIFYSFFYFSTQPIQNYLLTQYLPEHRQGIGFGIHFFLTFGVGSTAAAVCGYLADHFGLQSVFYAMGLCFILSSCLALVLVLRVKSAKTGQAGIDY